jgi:hypothetical protein
LLKYNIAYILTAGFKEKIPLLVVLIKKFSTAEGDATATLKDPTGLALSSLVLIQNCQAKWKEPFNVQFWRAFLI